jgi:hypothetical protein
MQTNNMIVSGSMQAPMVEVIIASSSACDEQCEVVRECVLEWVSPEHSLRPGLWCTVIKGQSVIQRAGRGKQEEGKSLEKLCC